MLSVIDSKSLRGVTSLAMDVLVFAAISTLNIETVKTFFRSTLDSLDRWVYLDGVLLALPVQTSVTSAPLV